MNTNLGNFRSLLAFRVDSGDELLKEHISLAPRNAVYTSNTIQNNLISLIGKWIQKSIINDIKQGSGVFAIIADEGRDCSNQEHDMWMSIPVFVNHF